MRAPLLCLLGLLTASAASGCELALVQPGQREDAAVVLVGGLDGGPEFFAPWMSQLMQQQVPVWGAHCSHRQRSMTDSARQLAAELAGLPATSHATVAVLAHSMGGLVALRSLHELDSQHRKRFAHVQLHTYGTPYGGFLAADFAPYLPGTAWLARAVGLPMGLEIGSRSSFMRQLTDALPDGFELHIHDGQADSVVAAHTGTVARQYASVLLRARQVSHWPELNHTDYALRLAPPALGLAAKGPKPTVD